MFAPTDHARIFGVPLGANFVDAVAEGVVHRLGDGPPERLARVHILVNTGRMQRRLREAFASGPPRLLPKIGLITDIEGLVPEAELPDPISALQRRMDLAELVAALLEADPTLAPRSALFDLADSLTTLLDELHGEGVHLDAVEAMDTGDLSGHWKRSQQFLSLVTQYIELSGETLADAEARRRLAVKHLIAKWQKAPPVHPIIVAGSTASRGTTALLMQAVSRLPQGALILPGLDRDLPRDVWKHLLGETPQEDHPQYRLAKLARSLDTCPSDIPEWFDTQTRRARNRLISLSLRPAPTTHQWLSEGPDLGDLSAATRGASIIEAPSARMEATAIALAMIDTVAKKKTVALITPDRTLGRRVTAILDRFGIVPDDSAGRPLSLTPPGRIIRQVATLMGTAPRSEDMIALLRHPLTQTDGTDRGENLLRTQEFELFLRKGRILEVTRLEMENFAEKNPHFADWSRWVAGISDALIATPAPTLAGHVSALMDVVEDLAAGPERVGTGELWEKEAGQACLSVLSSLHDLGDSGPAVSAKDVKRLVDRALQSENIRDTDTVRKDVMIWGTLEARVQNADVNILGGLNEGVWPSRPTPDPWLNRAMRKHVGLLLPERQIGLSAHDYQQAVAAEEVILSRSVSDGEATTVPSRWLNRLKNLLDGLPDQNGKRALHEMKRRGNVWLKAAQKLDQPNSREKPKPIRPAPAPPVRLRPKILSVTEIEKLIRDPYSIYARHVLGLRALNDIRPSPDAAMRGTVLHAILHCLLEDAPFPSENEIEAKLLRYADEILVRRVPWPMVRAHWFGHLKEIAPEFARMEWKRQSEGTPVGLEVSGICSIAKGPYSVKGKADRIDLLNDGRLAIYDYKSGGPPTTEQVLHFQRQLPIEAVMAEAGAFEHVDAGEVAFVAHIGLNKDMKQDRHDMVLGDKFDFRTVTIAAELLKLLSSYENPRKGYQSRRAMEKVRWEGDYDHLARFGEWDLTVWPETLDLT